MRARRTYLAFGAVGSLLAFLLLGFSATDTAAQSQYGGCLDTANSYQSRYESSGQVKDLVCMQKAMEREMNGSVPYSCSLSAQHYQTAYERDGRVKDLICMQEALEREFR